MQIPITLTIPDALVPRIMDALRFYHPDVTGGLGDLAAFKDVVRFWVVRDLMSYEGEQAGGDAFALSDAARAAAAAAAMTDAGDIS